MSTDRFKNRIFSLKIGSPVFLSLLSNIFLFGHCFILDIFLFGYYYRLNWLVYLALLSGLLAIVVLIVRWKKNSFTEVVISILLLTFFSWLLVPNF